ncbi:MAG: symbB, partial [Chloroflexi bacterium]|nr:symbB [Chloroflexota bacterium]
MLVFAGASGTRLDDLWAYRAATDSWVLLGPSNAPGLQLQGHTAVWDSANAQMLVFGGASAQDGDLWSYHPATNIWRQPTPSGEAPRRRSYHSAVWDPASARMIVFGGVGGSFETMNDVWAFSPAANSWTELQPEPPRPFPRFYHRAVWDPVREQMLVFGGAEPFFGSYLDDLWAYQPRANTWTDLTGDEAAGPRGRLSYAT